MDGRYKEGIKDLLEEAQRTERPFSVKAVKREQKRHFQLALLAISTPLLVLALLFYIQEVNFDSQSAMISLLLAGISTILFLLFLIPARWNLGKLPFDTEFIWEHWHAYLKDRMRYFWLLHTGIVCAMASLINVTYDIDQSTWSKWMALILVGFAAIILMNNFFRTSYKYALKEAANALK